MKSSYMLSFLITWNVHANSSKELLLPSLKFSPWNPTKENLPSRGHLKIFRFAPFNALRERACKGKKHLSPALIQEINKYPHSFYTVRHPSVTKTRRSFLKNKENLAGLITCNPLLFFLCPKSDFHTASKNTIIKIILSSDIYRWIHLVHPSLFKDLDASFLRKLAQENKQHLIKILKPLTLEQVTHIPLQKNSYKNNIEMGYDPFWKLLASNANLHFLCSLYIEKFNLPEATDLAPTIRELEKIIKTLPPESCTCIKKGKFFIQGEKWVYHQTSSSDANLPDPNPWKFFSPEQLLYVDPAIIETDRLTFFQKLPTEALENKMKTLVLILSHDVNTIQAILELFSPAQKGSFDSDAIKNLYTFAYERNLYLPHSPLRQEIHELQEKLKERARNTYQKEEIEILAHNAQEALSSLVVLLEKMRKMLSDPSSMHTHLSSKEISHLLQKIRNYKENIIKPVFPVLPYFKQPRECTFYIHCEGFPSFENLLSRIENLTRIFFQTFQLILPVDNKIKFLI